MFFDILESNYSPGDVICIKLTGEGGGTWWPGFVSKVEEDSVICKFWSDDADDNV